MWQQRQKRRRGRGGLGALMVAGLGAGLWYALRGKRGDNAGNSGDRPQAHRADGSDDSASFAAGIADEGTIPETAATPAI